MPSLNSADWRTSSFCTNGSCVQVAAVDDGTIAVRDSKNPDGAVLLYTPAEWRDFLAGAKSGDFDDLLH